jgi:hypothetical protein
MVEKHKVYQLIKPLRKSPLILTGIILQVLRQWFANNSDQFKYTDEKVNSKIDISPSYNWEPDRTQSRPGLYIKRGTYMPKGMGRAGMEDLLRLNIKAESDYLVLPVCPVTVFCVGKLPGEVESLAWEAAQLLIAMSPYIKKDFNFLSFNVDQVGEIGQIEEYKEFWTVPIGIATSFSEDWRIKEAAPLLKRTLVDAYTTLIGVLDKPYGKDTYNEDKYK